MGVQPIIHTVRFERAHAAAATPQAMAWVLDLKPSGGGGGYQAVEAVVLMDGSGSTVKYVGSDKYPGGENDLGGPSRIDVRDIPQTRYGAMRKALSELDKFLGANDVVHVLEFRDRGEKNRVLGQNLTKANWPNQELASLNPIGGGTSIAYGIEEGLKLFGPPKAGVLQVMAIMTDAEDTDHGPCRQAFERHKVPAYLAIVGIEPRAEICSAVQEASGCPLPPQNMHESGDFVIFFDKVIAAAHGTAYPEMKVTLALKGPSAEETYLNLGRGLFVYLVAPNAQRVKMVPASEPNAVAFELPGGMSAQGAGIYFQATEVNVPDEKFVLATIHLDWKDSNGQSGSESFDVEVPVQEGLGTVDAEVTAQKAKARKLYKIDEAARLNAAGQFKDSQALVDQLAKDVSVSGSAKEKLAALKTANSAQQKFGQQDFGDSRSLL